MKPQITQITQIFLMKSFRGCFTCFTVQGIKNYKLKMEFAEGVYLPEGHLILRAKS
jgi:hypothetical protein